MTKLNKLAELQQELTTLISLLLSLCPALNKRFLRMRGLVDITVVYHDLSGRETFKVIESRQVNGVQDRIEMLYSLHMLLSKYKPYNITLQYDTSRGNLINTYYLS